SVPGREVRERGTRRKAGDRPRGRCEHRAPREAFGPRVRGASRSGYRPERQGVGGAVGLECQDGEYLSLPHSGEDADDVECGPDSVCERQRTAKLRWPGYPGHLRLLTARPCRSLLPSSRTAPVAVP